MHKITSVFFISKYIRSNALNSLFIISIFLLVFTSSCNGCKPKEIAKAGLDFTIDKTNLSGKERDIKIQFQVAEEHASQKADLSKFKFKVGFLVQKGFRNAHFEDHINGSAIQYQITKEDAPKQFHSTFQKPLTDFTNFIVLDANSDNSDNKTIDVDFKLLPIKGAIEIKIHFELENIQTGKIIEKTLSWIKNPIAIHAAKAFQGEDVLFFTIKSLQQNFQDLHQYVVKLIGGNNKFVFENNDASEATLAELLPNLEIRKNEETSPIGVKIHNTENLFEKLTIELHHATEAPQTPALAYQKVDWLAKNIANNKETQTEQKKIETIENKLKQDKDKNKMLKERIHDLQEDLQTLVNKQKKHNQEINTEKEKALKALDTQNLNTEAKKKAKKNIEEHAKKELEAAKHNFDLQKTKLLQEETTKEREQKEVTKDQKHIEKARKEELKKINEDLKKVKNNQDPKETQLTLTSHITKQNDANEFDFSLKFTNSGRPLHEQDLKKMFIKFTLNRKDENIKLERKHFILLKEDIEFNTDINLTKFLKSLKHNASNEQDFVMTYTTSSTPQATDTNSDPINLKVNFTDENENTKNESSNIEIGWQRTTTS